MLVEQIEGKWVDVFKEVFNLCRVAVGDEVVILSESQSRQVNVRLADLALLALGAKVFHLVLPSPKLISNVPVRSTGSSDVLHDRAPIIAALARTTLVVDLTVEGLLHAPELPSILEEGTRVLMISNEHPEALERLRPDENLRSRVQDAVRKAKEAKNMLVTSDAGTELSVSLTDCPIAGVWGWTDRPGTVAHWPGGVVVAFPLRHSVRGRLVLGVGDINLTFKRYLESPVTLIIEDDYVTAVEGSGVDAILMRNYYDAWNDSEAYGVSHVGWGLNPKARYEALTVYDKRDTNGTELRALAGNFLFSTGANEHAGRYTLGHFDLPVLGCTIKLDDEVVVENGKLLG
jgi:2,5-dihydroxypyridine 5,6-dioxygenase